MDDRAEILEPLAVLPVQMGDDRQAPPSPERLLALAVLDDALATLVRTADAHRGRQLREFQEAYRWFCDDRRDWGFSFLNLCDWLGLDVSAVRRHLQRVVPAC